MNFAIFVVVSVVVFAVGTLVFGGVSALDVRIWLWLNYRRFYEFPDTIYTNEVYLPLPLKKGIGPLVLASFVIAPVSLLVAIFSNGLLHTTSLIFLVPSGAIFLSLILKAYKESVTKCMNPEATGRELAAALADADARIVVLSRNLDAPDVTDDLLMLYRRYWRAMHRLDRASCMFSLNLSLKDGNPQYAKSSCRAVLGEARSDIDLVVRHAPDEPDRLLLKRARKAAKNLAKVEDAVEKGLIA